jgi:hypothetical protein
LCLVRVFRLSAFHSPPPEVGPLRAPIASSPIVTFLSGVSARLHLSLLWLIVLLFVLCFILVSLYLFYFVLIFLCILFLLGFPIYALVFPCIASLCLFRGFFSFYNSADFLRAYFATLRPLADPFFVPPPRRAPTHPSMYKFACTRSVSKNNCYICISWFCLVQICISLVD